MADGTRPGARDYLDEAIYYSDRALEETEDRDYCETRELTSLFYSVAMSLADIADALKAGTAAPVAESLPGEKMQAGPDTVTDRDGDEWIRLVGTTTLYAMPRTGQTLEEIRRTYGIQGENAPEGR